MFYFSIFPKINYSLLGDKNIEVMNITKRYKFVEDVLKDKYVLYDYTINEGDRPDIIAEKYYNDATLDWIILLTNKIIDPFFEWPLTYSEFNLFIKKKYGSIEYASQTDHSYYEIVQERARQADGTVVEERIIRIDQTAYENTVDDFRLKKTLFQYEQELNDNRMHIKLIDKSYISQILTEVRGIYGNS